MEQVLLKMARQLDSLDEASLMALWDKYAAITLHFEPTQRWEEAALIFAFLQAKRWKNQAFNYYWALQRRPASGVETPIFNLERRKGRKNGSPDPASPVSEKQKPKKAVVLPFVSLKPQNSGEKTRAPEEDEDKKD